MSTGAGLVTQSKAVTQTISRSRAKGVLAEGPAPIPRKEDARNQLPGASPLKYADVTAHRRLVPLVGPEVRL